MKFTVKTLDGKTQDFDLPGTLTVIELKAKVEETIGIPAGTQRMLAQGKLMKDDQKLENYDIEGKIIHVVKSAPAVQKSSPSPRILSHMPSEKISNEFMNIGVAPEVIPPPSEEVYVQALVKDSCENILDTVIKGGHPNALVTVTIHTLGPDGRPIYNSNHTATSYKPGDDCLSGPPDPALIEEEERQRKRKEEERQARRERLARYNQRIKEQQRRGREQTNILEVYQHMTSVRRAIQGAENILEGYLNSSEYREAKEMLEHHMKLKKEYEEKIAAEKEAMEKEAMESEEGGATAATSSDKSSEATGGVIKEGVVPMRKDAPQYAMGDDGRPRQHILTDTGMLLPAGAHLYAALIDDIINLQRRGIEMHEFYARKIYAEEQYEMEDSRIHSKLVSAVHRFHNAMGQAYSSIKKVQVTLEGEPPRTVSLAPGARAANPLLSLLNQPLSRDDGPGNQDDDEEDESIAGLLGSLMATRAAMNLMENEERQTQRNEQRLEQNSTTETPASDQQQQQEEPQQVQDQESSGATAIEPAGNGGRSQNDDDDDDDDEINPFLPGPVHLLQQIMKQKQEREREQQQQQQQERTIVIQPNQPFYDVIARIRQAVGGPEDEIMPPTLIGNLVERIMKKMSITEVVTVFGGVTGPLKAIHGTLRDFVKERLLDGEEPTADKIPLAITNFVKGLPQFLKELQPPLPLDEDIDFGESAKKCCAFMLEEVMDMIVNTPDDDEEFPQKLHDWAMKMGIVFTLLLQECLESSNDLNPSLKRISKMMFPDNDTPGVLSMLNSQSLVDKFIKDAEESSITKEEISRHIVYINPPDDDDDGDEGQQKMETEPPAGATGTREGTGDKKWPPAMPQEWIPAIEKDQEQMASMSEAYLSSLPSKKRKQLETEGEHTVHISEILDETLTSAINIAGVTTTSGASTEDVVKEIKTDDEVIKAMAEDFHGAIKERLEDDPTYDPSKYPNAQKLFAPKK